MRRAWLLLGFLQRVNGRRLSITVLAIVPLLVSLKITFDSFDGGFLATIITALVLVLEKSGADMPINLVRAFWSALSYLLASLVFSLAFPAKLKTLDQWLISPGARMFRTRERLSRQNVSDEQLDSELEKIWKRSDLRVLSFSTFGLLVSTFLLSFSIYLSAIVILENANKLYETCPFGKLVTWNANKC